MTPPVQEHALEASTRTRSVADAGRSGRFRFLPGDLVSLSDIWILLAIMWGARLAARNGALDPAVAVFGLTAFAVMLSPKVNRVHREQLSPSAIDDAGDVGKRVLIAYAIASAASAVSGVGDLRLLLFVAAITAPAILITRAAAYGAERSLRQNGRKARTLVVGAGDIAHRVITTINEHSEYGLEVVGAVDDDPKFGSAELGARVIGGIGDVPELVDTHQVENVIVAFSSSDQGRMVDVLRGAMSSGANAWVVPRFFELASARSGGDHLWGLPLVRLQPPARSRPEWFLKRALDSVVAFVGVVLTAPIMALVAIATLIDSGRPIFYKQSRVGLDGHSFDILKFRTMRKVDDSVENTEWAADEHRMTKLGSLLRRSSLDELPQLFNVLKGDMSLVGPRPERPYFVGLFSDLYPQYKGRTRVPAGVTGWSQIHGLKGDTSIEERAVFDNYYIENWSLAQDIKIIAKTAITFFREGRSPGEERGDE